MNGQQRVTGTDYEVFYIPHPDHRNRTREKSQWTIEIAEELDCFRRSIELNKHQQLGAWGLHLVDDMPAYLGVYKVQSGRPREPLFLAKFVDGGGTDQWHGYPVDHRDPSDKPTPDILNYWYRSGLLKGSKIRKITQGQPCKL